MKKLRMLSLDPVYIKNIDQYQIYNVVFQKREEMFCGKIVGVNGLLLRFFDNGLRILGFESGTLVGFILMARSIVVMRVGDTRGLIKMGNLSETTSIILSTMHKFT